MNCRRESIREDTNQLGYFAKRGLGLKKWQKMDILSNKHSILKILTPCHFNVDFSIWSGFFIWKDINNSIITERLQWMTVI